MKKLKNDKSPGYDNILNEFLKQNTTLFKKTLLSIFNLLFKKGYFPDAWSVGMIIPIFKTGDPNLPENYRGITLLSCIGKLFTSMINSRLNLWAELNNKYDNHQYGFRDKRGTVDAMFILQNIVDIFLKQNNALYVCFIDLKKAFDCTNHNALWYKLNLNNVSFKIINILKNMYEKMKMCVKNTLLSSNLMPCDCTRNVINTFCLHCNSQTLGSCFFQPNAGVLQGESLSPTIFSFFLNDLNDYLKEDPSI